jgi:hypothetical protein
MTRIAIAVALLLGACTKENKEFCCTSGADCASVGLTEDHRDCNEGLACVDHSCAPASCATEGCSAAAPTCDVTIDVCAGCTSSTECTRFPTTSVCEPTSGACVGCLGPSECAAVAPVCDGNACRGCRSDSECPSGACADDGSCVAEAAIVYVATTGVDASPCSRTQPCLGLRYALQETSASRPHVVFAPGTYPYPQAIDINATTTTAPFLTLHGGGAKLTSTSDDGLLLISKAGAMRDIELLNTNGAAASITGGYTLERVTIRGEGSTSLSSVIVNGSVTFRDITITGTGCGLRLDGGAATIDRGTIAADTKGVCANGPAAVDIVNLLVWKATETALDLPGVTGSIRFATIANTGATGTGAGGLRCTQAALAVTSSILWTPTAQSYPTVMGACDVSGSIVGPTSFPNNMNVDPLFRNANAHDFRLSGGSPAHDVVNSGPTFDFEHDPRPQGPRFDLGADEGL